MKKTLRKMFLELANLFTDEKSIGEDSMPYPTPNMASNGASARRMPGRIEELNHGMNLVVYNATGGKVIQVWAYDPIKDRHYSNLHLITDDQDLGQELSLIITRESLTR